MGQTKSSNAINATKVKPPKGGLFSWQTLDAPSNQSIHYDPRYEDVAFKDNCVLISDYHKRVFEWESKINNTTGKPMGYELKSFKKYEYENKSGTQAGKRFDANATSLAWIHKHIVYYYDLNTETVYFFDVSNWLINKYTDNYTASIPPKAIINLGNGQVLFMVSHFQGNDKTAKNIKRGTDIVQMDIINKKEMKTVNIQHELLSSREYHCVYWGFQLNPNGKEISVILQSKRNVSYVCFISLIDGSIIWSSQFDFVHDLSFSSSGKYACVFERPRKTEFGYVHVLNLTRLEWLSQIQLTYGTSPLGWDGFTWMGDSLVFMAPFDVKVSSPGDLQWRNVQTIKENEALQKMHDELKKKLQQQQDLDDNDNDNDIDIDNNTNDNTDNKDNDDDKKKITPQKFDAILQQQKSKEICVLSIGSRWWDLEPEVMDTLYSQIGDENLSQLILEFSGLSWAMIRFPYPEFNTNKNDQNAAFMLQGAMSEVFQSGTCSNFNVLLLAKIGRDPNISGGPFNHWMFTACLVPKTFKEMWNNPQIQQGVIGSVANVKEKSNLKTLDQYD